MSRSTITCESIESMMKIVVMLIRENIVFVADDSELVIYIRGY